jgi:hypothetical protein
VFHDEAIEVAIGLPADALQVAASSIPTVEPVNASSSTRMKCSWYFLLFRE